MKKTGTHVYRTQTHVNYIYVIHKHTADTRTQCTDQQQHGNGTRHQPVVQQPAVFSPSPGAVPPHSGLLLPPLQITRLTAYNIQSVQLQALYHQHQFHDDDITYQYTCTDVQIGIRL